ncbi:MAG: SIR2 family protein [Acidobacteriota bacterium]|nr:SIR2 family protein [Acidobacteriota bacterium]
MTGSADATCLPAWPTHYARAGTHVWSKNEAPDPEEQKLHIRPWLSALIQGEHVNLLVGSGLTTAVGAAVDVAALDMGMVEFRHEMAGAIQQAAEDAAERSARGKPNFEDQMRAVAELVSGLRILGLHGDKDASAQLRTWEREYETALQDFWHALLLSERQIRDAFADGHVEGLRLLSSFFQTFSNRPGSRERLHIFTTNYDRLIEYGCEFLGLRVLDRFVGRLSPVFRSSRPAVDLHYNPPGLRGEPRYLDGVVRLTKLHGSLDWHSRKTHLGGPEIVQHTLPFGAEPTDSEVSSRATNSLMIYPNAAKDTETLEYPYADLFRDFAAAVCRPDTVLVTYGYGFGDDHVNRVIRDMLTIPSTHLVILSYEDTGRRAERFVKASMREQQITILVGEHFGSLFELVEHYLPKPYIDFNLGTMTEILKRTRPDPHVGGGGQNEEPDGKVANV